MTTHDLAQIRTIVEETVGGAESRLQRSLEDGLTRIVLEMNARFDGVAGQFEGIALRFDGVSAQFVAIDRRFDRIEMTMSRMESRIEHLETDVAELKLRFPRRLR